MSQKLLIFELTKENKENEVVNKLNEKIIKNDGTKNKLINF